MNLPFIVVVVLLYCIYEWHFFLISSLLLFENMLFWCKKLHQCWKPDPRSHAFKTPSKIWRKYFNAMLGSVEEITDIFPSFAFTQVRVNRVIHSLLISDWLFLTDDMSDDDDDNDCDLFTVICWCICFGLAAAFFPVIMLCCVLYFVTPYGEFVRKFIDDNQVEPATTEDPEIVTESEEKYWDTNHVCSLRSEVWLGVVI